jgi:UDP-2,3-diacylglucosamine pyrophosphatase LpxH
MKRKLVFISDTQAPYHLPQAVALVCAFIKDYKPSLVVLGGDMVDFVSLSKFTKVGRYTPTNIVDELKIYEAEVLEPIAKASGGCEMIHLEGNHEFRLIRYVATFAKPLEDLIDLTDILGCKKHGIKYIKSKAGNAVHKLTKHLALMHGERLGVNPAKAQYEKWGGSLVMGHSHKESTWRWKHGCGSDHVAIAAGCLCKDPDWMDIDNYTRGFVAGWFDDETGEFGLDHVRIIGRNHNEIASPWGAYKATKVHNPQDGEHWLARRGKNG